ncbi:MAG: nucleotide exchange factor GrpE [Acidimicrobiales bacterium]|nr:nucleotide exchange factor GrpE [Acidimicrobiales bacterium]
MTDVPNDGMETPESDSGVPEPEDAAEELDRQGSPPDLVPDDLSGLDDTPPAPEPSSDLSVEDLVISLESVSLERDQYLDALRRVQAEFENYKKAITKRTADERERANDRIINELLPVLDACDGAVANGGEQVLPVRKQLLAALGRHGLERSDPAGKPFDPEEHEAVMHEDSDEVEGPIVVEVLRPGYLWNGRVVRPAMVRVKG